MNFTPQQHRVVHYKGDALLVKSGAGTGKTKMLCGYAEANPSVRMLYLCYNKAIQEEAEGRFPKNNVVCRTLHAIAYAIVGIHFKHKLTHNLRLADIKKFLDIPSWEIAKEVSGCLDAFLCSASREIGPEHVPAFGALATPPRRRDMVVKYTKTLWAAVSDVEHPFPCTHDVYLKLYCLREPDLHRWFGVILFDEAQDANPVVSDFIFRQKCKLIVVGDDHQQLYRWRGANNAMNAFAKAKNAEVMMVNKSFRFGAQIAKLASAILTYKTHITGCDPFEIMGNETIQDAIYDALPRELMRQRHTVLHRTVSGTIKTAMAHIDKRIYWVGGIDNYNLQEIADVYHFAGNQRDKIQRKKLTADYRNYDDYKRAAKDTLDPEMNRVIKIIDENGSSILRKISVMRKNAVKEESKADIVVSTAHRSKGLEWDIVLLADDFRDLLSPDLDMDEELIGDELNLLYVACTRAMKYLQPNSLVIGLNATINGPKSTLIQRAAKTYDEMLAQRGISRPKGNPDAPPQRVTLGE